MLNYQANSLFISEFCYFYKISLLYQQNANYVGKREDFPG
jgi:hypothetical protein